MTDRIEYFSVPQFDDTGLTVTVMTSEGHGCWLSNREDGHAGYRAVAAHYGILAENMVGTFQRHSAVVRKATSKEGGKNILWRDREPESVDGLITNEPGLMLCSMESDCTPVYLLDPVKKAIGMVHSGWKGTAALIAVNAVKLMETEYGCRAEDILIAFGPCNCRNCYEVSEDLFEPFSLNYDEAERSRFFVPKPKSSGKYLLDVNLAIMISLQRAGVRSEHIFDTGRCTYHEKVFYSHRRQLRDGLPGTDNMFTGIMLLQ